MSLTEKQLFFKEEAMKGANCFLTGKAGTGKSFVLLDVMEEMKAQDRKFIALAPTGIAANNIGGATIHSQFGIPPFGILSYEDVNFLKGPKRQVLEQAKTYIIDEISMMRPDLLDGIHWTLKKNGLKGLHTKQIIFCGDLKQLPPVLEDNARTVLYEIYKGETFDRALIMEKLNVQTIELDEVRRQTNEEFINNLNIVRGGGKSDYFRRFVHTQAQGIILAPHNATVAQYNHEGLMATPGKEHTFIADIEGSAKPQDFNLEYEVKVKHGCKIMYLVNSQNNPLRNGTLGTFVVKNDRYFIRVGNVDYSLERTLQVKKEYVYDRSSDRLQLQELGKITQMPIKLAYALSIHKAQGLTFDEVTVDLRRPCFQRGQMYVALSRVRTPEGLRIITP
jgi:ATP-dependent DNA helicase PIF1